MTTPGLDPRADLAVAASPYLQGGTVGFREAIKQALRNGFVYRGRASRPAYWWFILFQGIYLLATQVLLLLIPDTSDGNKHPSGVVALLNFLLIFSLLFFVYLALVSLALLVRRLHDIDKSAWWILVGLVPLAGPVILLILTLLEGTAGLNRYQPS